MLPKKDTLNILTLTCNSNPYMTIRNGLELHISAKTFRVSFSVTFKQLCQNSQTMSCFCRFHTFFSLANLHPIFFHLLVNIFALLVNLKCASVLTPVLKNGVEISSSRFCCLRQP